MSRQDLVASEQGDSPKCLSPNPHRVRMSLSSVSKEAGLASFLCLELDRCNNASLHAGCVSRVRQRLRFERQWPSINLGWRIITTSAKEGSDQRDTLSDMPQENPVRGREQGPPSTINELSAE